MHKFCALSTTACAVSAWIMSISCKFIRWDYNTPIEETLEALNDVVKVGKARYIGASSMHASQFAQALELQKQHGWAQFVSMQDHYNLIYREEEREMLPLCYQEGVAVIHGARWRGAV